MSRYDVVQKIVVVMGNFQETNAHTESRLVFVDPIEIRPNHFARDIYDLVIGGNDADAIIFIQGEGFFTGDENAIRTDVFGFALDGTVVGKYIDGPCDSLSWVFTPFGFLSHSRTSLIGNLWVCFHDGATIVPSIKITGRLSISLTISLFLRWLVLCNHLIIEIIF